MNITDFLLSNKIDLGTLVVVIIILLNNQKTLKDITTSIYETLEKHISNDDVIHARQDEKIQNMKEDIQDLKEVIK